MSFGHSLFLFFSTHFWLSDNYSKVNEVAKLYLVTQKWLWLRENEWSGQVKGKALS